MSATHKTPHRTENTRDGETRVAILLAIGDPVLRKSVARILAPHYTVETIDKEGLLSLAPRAATSLVVIDLDASHNGIGLLRALRRHSAFQAMPVIVIAAASDQQSLADALAEGASDFLTGPAAQRELLARVATQLELSRLRATHSALNEATRQKEALYQLTDQLQRATSAEGIYDAALDAIINGLRCDRASILLYDDGGVMRFVAWRGLSDDYRRIAEGHSPWARDEPNPVPLGVSNIEDAQLDAKLMERIRLEGIQAAAFIPLVCDGQLIGKFMTYFNVPHVFRDGEMALGLTIARQLAFALQRQSGVEALRATEERLRIATQTGKIGLWEWDVVEDRVIWSESMFRLHGMAPENFDATIEGFRSYVHPDDRAQVNTALRRALSEDAPYELTFRVLSRTGEPMWLYTTAVVVRQGSRPVRMVGAVTDVTHLKNAEQAVRQAQEDLKLADRRKDEFIAMLAHELRNPLAPIANAVHLMRRAASADPAQMQARGIIERQMGRLTRLVDDLLDVSRITSGRVQLHREQIPIDVVLERALETVRPLIGQEHQTLKVSLTDEPIWVFADATRLEQVFGNLLNNAAKYTPTGGHIELTTGMEAGQAVVRVRDTGIGIDAALLPHVFELFTQAERTLDRSRGGLGVGLSVVQRLVQMHGGTVEAKSSLGQGSEFTVRLPVMAAPAVAVQPADAAQVGECAAHRLRILVVDDNEDAARSMGMLLSASGHHVKLAFDGEEAIDAAHEHKPHLVFLDIGLPKLSGYEVARHLRCEREFDDTVLVAMTGYGQPEDVARSDEAGFHHHLVKPAELGAVERLVNERAERLAN